MNERLKFVAEHQRGRSSMTDLCRSYGISRKTGYKLIRRYSEEGPSGLEARPSTPRSQPNRTPLHVEAAVLRVRKAYPTWGSKKILAYMDREAVAEPLPARSTVDSILKRAGLVVPRRRRGKHVPRTAPNVEPHSANEVWSIDYKGWFLVGDGTRCDPLTVNDGFSRYSLVLRAMVSPKLEDVRYRLDTAFAEYGLPTYMLSDNGPPFGSRGLGGLSRLSVWLIKLGVQPVFIEPGHPEQNGKHERFHETLIRECLPPRPSIRAQQAAFTRYRPEYNDVRPHEALDMRTPSELYEPSTRCRPFQLEDHEYEEGFKARRVRRDGSIKWDSGYCFVGEAMAGEMIGLKESAEGLWDVQLGRMKIGLLCARTKVIGPVALEAV